MNLRERCLAVFQAGYQFSYNSFRAIAQETNLSKSSVHRLYHRIANRNQHPESSLWESPEGQKWLRLLVLASIFIFALQGGIGCERLSSFFHLLRLQRHIGVSPTALRSLRARMESAIIEYQQRQNEVLNQISSEVEVCLAADETFFEGVILVMLDLPSGYIFVEEITEDCQYETWQQRVSQIFQPLGLKVKYLVSDRAKAIIKLALNDLGTNSISDLFHVLYDLNRSIGFELNRLGSRLEKQILRAKLNQSKPEIIKELELKKLILQKSQVSYNHCCYSISTFLHPFDINYNTVQSTELVQQSLENIQGTLQNIYTTHRLQDPRSGIRKLKTQIQSLSAIIDIWWSWVDECLANQDYEVNVRCWVREYLLPVIYWQQQASRTKNPHLRQDYIAANHRANQIFEQHPFTKSLNQSELEQWWNWGIWMVSKFQRSSSAVEGRNGYLSQIHHSRRGLSSKRLKVATVIHNFVLKRNDGTTAAERLFGQQFPDLFEYLVENIGELPQPRKSRKSSKPKTFTLPTVPS
jgi:hypothetical protein